MTTLLIYAILCKEKNFTANNSRKSVCLSKRGMVMAVQKSSLTDVNEIVRLSYLYDFYGALLKERHREIFEEYVLNDLSLSEIASEYEITRQGVYDIVKRCSERLDAYEEKLNLFAKFQLAKERLGQVEELVKEDCEGSKGQILELTQEIYEIL